MKKIKITTLSKISLLLSIFLFVGLFTLQTISKQEFMNLQIAANEHITYLEAVSQLKDASDFLTSQSRLFIYTGNEKYLKAYLKELLQDKNRENAITFLNNTFSKNQISDYLNIIINESNSLAQIELKALAIAAHAYNCDISTYPEELTSITLDSVNATNTSDNQIIVAKNLLQNKNYEDSKKLIADKIKQCMSLLNNYAVNKQNRSISIFNDISAKINFTFLLMIIAIELFSLILWKWIAKPLLHYCGCIKNGKITTVVSIAELDELARVYNQIYDDNAKTHQLIKYEAEHDPLTKLYNRKVFDQMKEACEDKDAYGAMAIIDVDYFKKVNDQYGHKIGDKILKMVAEKIKSLTRDVDYSYRIGGDEFAVIIMNVTDKCKDDIKMQADLINKELSQMQGLPAVSLSIGVAFKEKGESGIDLYKRADKALYIVKENGRHGCAFYEK